MGVKAKHLSVSIRDSHIASPSSTIASSHVFRNGDGESEDLRVTNILSSVCESVESANCAIAAREVSIFKGGA